MTSERYSEPHSAATRRGSDSSAAGVTSFETLRMSRFKTPRGASASVVRRAGGDTGVREILRVGEFDDRLGACIEDPGERRRRGLLDLCFLLGRLLVAFAFHV